MIKNKKFTNKIGKKNLGINKKNLYDNKKNLVIIDKKTTPEWQNIFVKDIIRDIKNRNIIARAIKNIIIREAPIPEKFNKSESSDSSDDSDNLYELDHCSICGHSLARCCSCHWPSSEEDDDSDDDSNNNIYENNLLNKGPIFDESTIHQWSDKYNDSCPICLEQFTLKDEIKLLDCRHHFHINCINNWTITKRCLICPMCKSKYN